MSRSNQICAIIDVQGFFVQKTFFPREISIVNNEYQICLEIVPEIDSDILTTFTKQFTFQQYQLHGIPVEKVLHGKTKKIYHISQLRRIVEEVYYRVRTEDKNLLGVKNQQVVSLLKEYQIPFFNFEVEEVGGEICPTLNLFDKFKKSIYCLLHAELKPRLVEVNHRCALRKAHAIWDWLTRKLNSDRLLDEIFPDCV